MATNRRRQPVELDEDDEPATRRVTFSDIVTMIVARGCYNNGHTVAEIAKAAKATPQKVRDWLHTTGVREL